MDHPRLAAPYPNQLFSFPPPNPSPNPIPFPIPTQTPNFFPSSLPHPPPPHHHHLSAAATTIPATVDLPTTLSALKDLIHRSNNAVQSLSDLLRRHPTDLNGCGDELIPCPFNPHHRMPPSSLFRHSLRCPSSPYASLDLDPLLQSLHYPTALKSSSDLQKQTSFLRTLHDSSADLCFSLDEYLDFGVAANFFYRDCPAAVGSSSDQDASQRMLTLPGVLSAECANFVGDGDSEMKALSRDAIELFPSELWMVRNETESWRDYPSVYSYTVLLAVLGLQVVKGCDFGKWVIANSPKYGVVIDVDVRDHIVVLLRLCLKAIVREASGLLEEVVSRNVKDGDVKVNMRSLSINCSVTVKVLMWLSSQFSIIYGELNGKFFAINLLKHCILESASKLLMFSSEENATHLPTSKESIPNLNADTSDVKEGLGRSLECETKGAVDETGISEAVYVSQVAAAVAALHERSMLEEKIKGFIVFQSLPKYQRMVEHTNLVKKADEARKRCPNYKPIIEHDGLPQQQQSNEERNRTKTIEEKLAEERDYKRRRMSYRGKKLKRTTVEVMRDIIEKYMDEIKQAGGIGSFVKGGAVEGQFQSESSAPDISLRNSSYGAAGGSTSYQRNQSDSNYAIKTPKFEDVSFEDSKQSRQDHHRDHKHIEDRKSYSRKNTDREYYSRSPERSRSYSRSHSQSSRREQDDVITRSRHHEAKRSNDYDRRSSSISNYMNYSNGAKTDQKSADAGRERRSTYRNNRSDSLACNAFEDRYDPSESHDTYEDETTHGNRYIGPDRVKAGEFHEQPSNYSANEQYPGYRKDTE